MKKIILCAAGVIVIGGVLFLNNNLQAQSAKKIGPSKQQGIKRKLDIKDKIRIGEITRRDCSSESPNQPSGFSINTAVQKEDGNKTFFRFGWDRRWTATVSGEEATHIWSAALGLRNLEDLKKILGYFEITKGEGSCPSSAIFKYQIKHLGSLGSFPIVSPVI